jgi:hypothetical protein
MGRMIHRYGEPEIKPEDLPVIFNSKQISFKDSNDILHVFRAGSYGLNIKNLVSQLPHPQGMGFVADSFGVATIG